jgi:cell division protease FtsH
VDADEVTNGAGAPDPRSTPSGQKDGRRETPNWLIGLVLVAGLGLLALIIAVQLRTPGLPDELTYASFLTEAANDRVQTVVIDSDTGQIEGTRVDGTTFQVQGPPANLPDADLALLDQHHVARNYQQPTKSADWGSLLVLVVPVALIGFLFLGMRKRSPNPAQGAAGFAASPGRVHTTERPAVTFRDVAGYEAVKDEIREVVDFLKEPERFREVGARIPKGLLLIGPPGTGKTLLAKAVAGEAAVPFISVTGSDFMEMFVGVGAARVRRLFEDGRKQAPSIIFIDEIDSVGRTRGTGLGSSHDEREQTLNQILSEMDGFETTEGIVVMAATNRPDILDPALLRAGRFDRQVLVPLPSMEERIAILRVHCDGKELADDADLGVVARGTPGMSGAELANVVNEAALGAVRRGDTLLSAGDFDQARDRVLMGLRRTSLVLSDDEKRVVAHHEAGHAVMAVLCEHADPVHKVTVLPSGFALGATQQLPQTERHLYSRSYLLDAIAVQLGGRAAEDMVFGDPSTGAANDLAGATRTARHMVMEWGMSDRLGPVAWTADGTALADPVGGAWSDETARLVDDEVARILDEQDARVRRVLHDHRSALDAVARELIEHETVDGATVTRLVTETRPARLHPTRPLNRSRLADAG